MKETRTGGWPASRAAVWEVGALGLMLLVGGWLRLRELGLMEFKADEALAVSLGREILDGHILTTGLNSSVGAKNPPLFVYLTALPLAIDDDPRAATVFIALLSIAAVALTYVVLRPRFGAAAALAAGGLFAVAPWAVLYSRKVWAQDMLPLPTVALLWVLFLVLERRRTWAVALVPVLLCIVFQLNFSAAALCMPVSAVLLYRAREVRWLALLAGAGVAVLLLAPWLVHEAAHDFEDVSKLFGGRGRGSAAFGAGAVEAVRQTFRLVGAAGWEQIDQKDPPSFVHDAGFAWTAGRVAGVAVGLLFLAGLVACVVRAVRAFQRREGWPWFELGRDGGRCAVLVVWLVALWGAQATAAPKLVEPHYLIVSYPVSFAVVGIGLAELVGLTRGRARHAVAAVAAATAVLVAVCFVAFTLSFHRFLDEHGGSGGDYGVAYREKVALAYVARAAGLGISNDPAAEFLVSGLLDPEEAQQVLVRNRLRKGEMRSCDGVVRTFGALDACFPAGR